MHPLDPFNISPDLKSKNRMCVYFHLVTIYAVLLVTMSTLYYKCGLSDMSGTDVLYWLNSENSWIFII